MDNRRGSEERRLITERLGRVINNSEFARTYSVHGSASPLLFSKPWKRTSVLLVIAGAIGFLGQGKAIAVDTTITGATITEAMSQGNMTKLVGMIGRTDQQIADLQSAVQRNQESLNRAMLDAQNARNTAELAKKAGQVARAEEVKYQGKVSAARTDLNKLLKTSYTAGTSPSAVLAFITNGSGSNPNEVLDNSTVVKQLIDNAYQKLNAVSLAEHQAVNRRSAAGAAEQQATESLQFAQKSEEKAKSEMAQAVAAVNNARDQRRQLEVQRSMAQAAYDAARNYQQAQQRQAALSDFRQGLAMRVASAQQKTEQRYRLVPKKQRNKTIFKFADSPAALPGLGDFLGAIPGLNNIVAQISSPSAFPNEPVSPNNPSVPTIPGLPALPSLPKIPGLNADIPLIPKLPGSGSFTLPMGPQMKQLSTIPFVKDLPGVGLLSGTQPIDPVGTATTALNTFISSVSHSSDPVSGVINGATSAGSVTVNAMGVALGLDKLGIPGFFGYSPQGQHPFLPGAAGVEATVARGMSVLGTPYAWGGGNANGPTVGIHDGGVADSYGDYNKVGFDCSGLMMFSFAAAGINLPHYSGYQYNAGPHYPLAQMQRGDMIFYGPGGSEHVALILGDGTMLEAPESGSTVKVSAVRTAGAEPYVVRML